MPLRALNKETGESVYSFLYQSKIDLLKTGKQFVCPASGIDCFPRQRGGYVLHFVRKDKPEQEKYLGHPETWQHLLGKQAVYEKIQPYLNNTGFSIELEYAVDIDENHGRIADLMLLDPERNPLTAYEIQISPISTDELNQRTQDYDKLGIDCIWIFGGENQDNTAIKDWSYSYCGFFRIISFPSNKARFEKSDLDALGISPSI
ncbi:MAG: hypothetical protein GVY17_03100 [Cyanobacteria bacterium]|jgi:competence CoiA-like predicted nuclease|nr:hypothetical protein [Cyanobacteria bacterium GSL.Bin21]